jgi:putative endonuclease
VEGSGDAGTFSVIPRLDRGINGRVIRAMREYHVYILANSKRGTIYIGVSGDLERRMAEHRSKVVESFTRRYGVTRLVHVETFMHPEDAIRREKRLKKWPRDWKINLIEDANPEWIDLAEG